MPRATIRFEGCIQDSQEYGSDDEYMISRVFFSIVAGGKAYQGLSVDIRQSSGGDYETGAIEVGRPNAYAGPMNYNAFAEAVEHYYRSLVGSKGTGIRIEGAKNVRMRDNKFIKTAFAEFEYADSTPGW